ncbi:hypothetical protein QIS99_08015 [Streptomyces sp. B-S-A8]|uniref:TPM domain-containing protein n=1 Tax=Streptomyces solicavernae TaxID=3043614 RepID=A0ABT6RP12_9ACTN|nr:hypothetical protein [Streptomyces sp. B-S-A8]MDI3386163.1 hypothetical protein [Streptomyces sp. B-S-A8]
MRPLISVRITVRVVLVVLLALGAAFAAAPGAQAETPVSEVAQALKKSPVYVDPAASGLLPAAEADALATKIENADKPVFVAVLPADYPKQDLFANLRTQTGVTGLYGIQVGAEFDARADESVLSQDGVGNLVRAVEGDTLAARLNNFADLAVTSANGTAPASWDTAADDFDPAGLIGLGAVALAGGAGAYALVRRNRKRKAEAEWAALAKLRVVVDEDITAFGEELDRLDFHPGEPGATDEMRTDYEHALDAYDRAKSLLGQAERPDDVRAVTEALEDGRFSLAVLAARREGRELPVRRPPCFFDPRHGPAVADLSWAPEGGTPRDVPVCAADRTRIEEGQSPDVRTVDTPHGRRPYYEAGPVYGPWAGGYFGGGLLPGLLMGTMLGHMMASPAYAATDYGAGGSEGGDVSGSDFGSGDFGGGFGDGGGFGGGDFGGGF